MVSKLHWNPSGILLLAALSCALYLAEGSFNNPLVDKDFTCPTGFIPLTDLPPYTTPRCRANPCYGNPGPCGANNQCAVKVTGASGFFFLETVCTCPAPSVVSHILFTDFCYVPGTDRCNPNPCKNGGTCTAVADFSNVRGAFQCACPDNFQGTTCELPSPAPQPIAKSGGGGPTFPPVPPTSGDQGQCGRPGAAADFPNRCWFNNDPQGRYVCCDNQGCDGFNADNLTPHCKNNGYVPPNFGVTGPVTPPPTGSSGTQPNQGVCGTGSAGPFPTRCYFNNDPQGRYVCCDSQGCDGFNADNLTPHCKNYGYVPPNFGVNGPIVVPSPGPTGDQGVCGKGAASAFPVRCWYNNDPQGRYVCCDNDGCDGFNPPGNFFPHCKSNGYVPPNL